MAAGKAAAPLRRAAAPTWSVSAAPSGAAAATGPWCKVGKEGNIIIRHGNWDCRKENLPLLAEKYEIECSGPEFNV